MTSFIWRDNSWPQKNNYIGTTMPGHIFVVRTSSLIEPVPFREPKNKDKANKLKPQKKQCKRPETKSQRRQKFHQHGGGSRESKKK